MENTMFIMFYDVYSVNSEYNTVEIQLLAKDCNANGYRHGRDIGHPAGLSPLPAKRQGERPDWARASRSTLGRKDPRLTGWERCRPLSPLY